MTEAVLTALAFYVLGVLTGVGGLLAISGAFLKDDRTP